MARCAKDYAVIDISWQDALRQFGGRGYYPHKSGKWKTKLSNKNKPISLGYYDTPEEAAEAIYEYRAKRLINALKQYGLNPDDAIILANRHLYFSCGNEFRLSGECLGVKNIPVSQANQKPKEKNQDKENKLNSEYMRRIARDLLNADQLKSALPKIGDVLEKMSYGSEEVHSCVVTYVNPDHFWYEVEFTFGEEKWKESFKLPERTLR